MLSMPPATITSWLPASSMSCANIAAFMPEPHILDSVTAPALLGRPPLNAAWRAGAWPWPAIRQLPNSTSPTASLEMPDRSTAARMAAPPRSCADKVEKSPWKDPIGVRAALTMTTDSAMGCSCGWCEDGSGGAALLVGDGAEVNLEFAGLGAEQQGEGGAEIVAVAPLAHVVVPAVPAAPLVVAHVGLPGHEVRALEQGNQH